MAREPFAALFSTIWIGGGFFWVIKGFSGDFSDEITEEKRRRNLIVGYLIQVAALLVIAYLFYFK